MIDLHCHILPGLDDGPQSLSEAVVMCRKAAADGIRTIVATPHFKPGTYEFTAASLTSSIAALQAELDGNRIALRILPGAEVAVSPEMHANMAAGGMTINGSRYFLAEFSPHSVPVHWDVFLANFLDLGMKPIIVHPERNAWFMRRPDALAAAVASGVLVQVTAMSITGGVGPEVQDCSIRLLRKNLVHIIASDGHSADARPPRLADAVALAADVVGRQHAEALVTSIPQAIIENRPVPLVEPLEASVPRKGWIDRWRNRRVASLF